MKELTKREKATMKKDVGYKCQKCGRVFEPEFLEIHHTVEGVVVICRKCHFSEHKPKIEEGIISQEKHLVLSPFREPPIVRRSGKGGGRPKIDRKAGFRLIALNKSRNEIKKALQISEATYWRIKRQWNELPNERQLKIRLRQEEEQVAKKTFIEYEYVQHWVTRMRSGVTQIKSWRQRFNACRKVWLILQKKNPQNWTLDDIQLRVLPEIRKKAKSVNHYLIALRSLRPDFKFPNKKGDVLRTHKKSAPKIDWKYVYERLTQEEGKLEDFFKAEGFKAELLKRLHVTLGCREGSMGVGGILGIEWNRINWKNKTIDVFEGKTGGGFEWLNCPINLFGERTFEMLLQYWNKQGRPTSGKIFENMTYLRDLRNIYRESAKAVNELYGSKGITPHFARKLHASLLIDADVPLEMVAGDKPFGIMGVGWEDLTTLKKYYLAFRKAKIEENRQKAQKLNI